MIRGPLALAFVALALADACAADGREVTIDNQTGGVVRGVYASPVDDDNWHRDRLDSNIQAGGKASIVLPGLGCRYDFRILLEQRPDETLLLDVDVCRAPLLTIDSRHGRHVKRKVAPLAAATPRSTPGRA